MRAGRRGSFSAFDTWSRITPAKPRSNLGFVCECVARAHEIPYNIRQDGIYHATRTRRGTSDGRWHHCSSAPVGCFGRSERRAASAVALGVRTVTWEGVIFWVVALSVVVTLAYAARWGRSQAIRQKSEGERLRRAWEEIARRYDLAVSFEWAIMEFPPRSRGSQYVRAAIVFRITNIGNSAAHNVHCEIRLGEWRLESDDMHRNNRDFYAPCMAPKTSKTFSKKGDIRVYGATKAHYRCAGDEAGEIEGIIVLEAPEKIA